MRILLIGFGNMGREIKTLVDEIRRDFEIAEILGREEMQNINKKKFKNIDVAIEFTEKNEVLINIEKLLSLGIPIVVGTTGWYGDLPKVKRMVKKYKGSLIYGGNFSIGANLFFNIVKYASQQIGNFSSYDVYGLETHHKGKKDSPSGTAKLLSKIILENFPSKNKVVTQSLNRRIDSGEMHFASVRGGVNKGRHEIVFDSNEDEIRLVHQAWGRRGFALGALLAANFIKNNKGLYEFSEIFSSISENSVNRKVGEKNE